jgi:hypothetical protein
MQVKDLIGTGFDTDVSLFDMTEIQSVLYTLQNESPIDLAHAEMLQQKALRGADILSEYLGEIVRVLSFLESKVNSTKNKVSLEYKTPDGSKATLDMKKWAAEVSPEVEAILLKLASIKGVKAVLDKKYDILIKSHHHYKDIATGMRRTVLGYTVGVGSKRDDIPEGY